jgi:hypothetical protein
MQNDYLQNQLDWARLNPVPTNDPENDSVFRSLVAHELKPSEKLLEFVQRSGLGKGTILAQKMTREEISRHVRQAALTASDDPRERFVI